MMTKRATGIFILLADNIQCNCIRTDSPEKHIHEANNYGRHFNQARFTSMQPGYMNIYQQEASGNNHVFDIHDPLVCISFTRPEKEE